MPVSMGNGVLDDMLEGGLPERRTVMVAGGPGTGKTTLGLQYLQAGLDAGDDCLFVSTEQTVDELRDSFESFTFALGHERLTVTSIHGAPGETLESEDGELTLQTLEPGAEVPGEWVGIPFTSEYLRRHLSRFAPVDRIVLDSVSGLRPLAEDYDVFRRSVLDLIRLFNDDLGATALFVAEEPAASSATAVDTPVVDPLQYTAHGVLRLWREAVEGDCHRFVQVRKMRGVDHDTRVFELVIDEDGLRVAPRLRSHPTVIQSTGYLETGLDTLDDLLGGGVALGRTMLIEHDGRTDPMVFVRSMLRTAFENEMAIVLVPPVNIPPRVLAEEQIGQMHELMDDDRVFLIDFPNIWENTRRNVFKPAEHNGDHPADVFRTIDERRGETPLFSAINIEAQLPVLDRTDQQRVLFWVEENLHSEDDTSVYFGNPGVMEDQLAEFYRNAAAQVVTTWRNRRSLQYIRVEKAPDGLMGASRLVEYLDEEPFVRVQDLDGA